MKLLIFDMDQTLVELFDIHNIATKESFKKILKLDVDLKEIDCFGRTLHENIFMMCKKHGVDEDTCNGAIPQIMRAYKKAFIRALPKNISKSVLPGVKELFEKLEKTDHMKVIVTGCVEDITHEVLKRTKLLKNFEFTVCGSRYITREKLVKKAVDRASRISGKRFRGEDIIVFGDSPRDIEAVQAYKPITIISMTGYYTKKIIESYNPSFIFKNLSNTAKIMKIIGK